MLFDKVFMSNSDWKMKSKNSRYALYEFQSFNTLEFCIQILLKFSFIWLKRKLLAFQTSITSHNDDKCVSLALIMNGFLAVALYYFV